MKSNCKHFVVLALFGTLFGWQAQTVDAQTAEQATEVAKQRVAERAADQAREAIERNSQRPPVRMHTHEPRRLQDARQRRRELMNSGRKLTDKQKRQLRRNIQREIERSRMKDNLASPVNGGPRTTAQEEMVKQQAALRTLEGSKEKLREEAESANRMARPLPSEEVKDEVAAKRARDTMVDMRNKMAEESARVAAQVHRQRAEIALMRDEAIKDSNRRKMQECEQMEKQLDKFIADHRARQEHYLTVHADEVGADRQLHGPVSSPAKRR